MFTPVPLPRKVIQTLYCTHLLSTYIIQTGLGMGMSVNGTAQSRESPSPHFVSAAGRTCLVGGCRKRFRELDRNRQNERHKLEMFSRRPRLQSLKAQTHCVPAFSLLHSDHNITRPCTVIALVCIAMLAVADA